jgi:hypothetical protein
MNRREALLRSAAVSFTAAGGSLLPTHATAQALPTQGTNLTVQDINNRLVHRRAFEAVVWGMPAANYQLMYQEMVDKVKGGHNQVLYWSRLLDWRN